VGTIRARWRKIASGVAVASAIVNPAVTDAQTRAGSAHSLEHVRSSDDILASTMRTAAAQSATFRALVSRVDASDGIVYVEPGTCRRGSRACLIRVSPGGANRFFRVHVETNRPEWDLSGAIAHELWHVIEVVGNRGVRDNAAMHLFYDRQVFAPLRVLKHGRRSALAIRCAAKCARLAAVSSQGS
jgi:hypothetical protein